MTKKRIAILISLGAVALTNVLFFQNCGKSGDQTSAEINAPIDEDSLSLVPWPSSVLASNQWFLPSAPAGPFVSYTCAIQLASFGTPGTQIFRRVEMEPLYRRTDIPSQWGVLIQWHGTFTAELLSGLEDKARRIAKRYCEAHPTLPAISSSRICYATYGNFPATSDRPSSGNLTKGKTSANWDCSAL